MKILVLGSGAREHAIVAALLAEAPSGDPAAHEIVVAPGNAGIASVVEIADIDPNDPQAVTNLANERSIQLVVVGPEAPLVAGVADALRTRGIPVFGPSQAAAALEGSKTFAKRIMDAAGVPTGRARRAATVDEVEAALDEFGAPFVVKADGLAAGKGVLVTHDREAARAHADEWLAHGDVLFEEFLDGQEVSLFFMSDGHTVLPLSPAQDYKRLLDGDAGPNTGGMGAYSPLPWLDDEFESEEAFVDEVLVSIALPTIRRLAYEGTPFIGLLYCGLILTSAGIRVIEFNARFGDPETQVILPRLLTPLSELLFASATGTLADQPRPRFSTDRAVTVVLASENYPEKPVTGRPLSGLAEAEAVPGVHIAHAATAAAPQGAPVAEAPDAEAPGTEAPVGETPVVEAPVGEAPCTEAPDARLITTGGRVLSVVATGTTFGEARSRAYEALSRIDLEGGHFRSDIAARVDDSSDTGRSEADASSSGISAFSGLSADTSGAPATAIPSTDPVDVPGAEQQPTAIRGWRHLYSGKVRDLYLPESAVSVDDAPALLVVASDRVSAFDVVLEPGIPNKGVLLSTLSRWWFEKLAGFANHLLPTVDAVPGVPPVPADIAERSMLVKPLDMFPIECVVRGYLSGSGWLEYQQSQSVCGLPLPAGLVDGDRLPLPIYTPAFKADVGDHDENITYERTVELVGAETAEALRGLSLAIYARASEIAEERGIILADTKFEFGADRETGEITLADEVLTSDSSRFWDAGAYDSGDRTASFDKQIVRNWLSANWNKQGTPPTLPAEIVERTAARYAELIDRLTTE